MPKVLKSFVIIALMCFFFGFVISTADARNVVIKLATMATENSNFMINFNKLNDEIEKQTDGRVKFKVYIGGTMGSGPNLFRKIRIGQINGASFTAGEASAVLPDLRAMSVPLLFRNYEEADYALRKLEERFRNGLDEKGYILLAFSDIGFAHLMSQQPIASVEDLKGKKVWIPQGDPVGQTVFENAGVHPLQLPIADVITSLQTGQLDTVANAPLAAVMLQWYTKIDYITKEPLLYVYSVVLIDKRTFSRISEKDQEIILKLFPQYFREITLAARKDNDNAVETMKKKGIQMVDVSPENYRGLKDLIEKSKKELYSEDVFSKDIIESIEASVKEYREAHKEKPEEATGAAE